jgi:hypothetical protein
MCKRLKINVLYVYFDTKNSVDNYVDNWLISFPPIAIYCTINPVKYPAKNKLRTCKVTLREFTRQMTT